jgi:hypothetical protein
MLRFTAKLDNKANNSETLKIGAEEIYGNFIQGKYDQLIFGEKPQLTKELSVILSHYNRDFIQRLFTLCDSRKNLDFWLQETEAKLPKDTWALAVNLGNNIVVLQYLKDHGWFDCVSEEDKSSLLQRAQKFSGTGLEYLKTEFAKSATKSACSAV